MSMVLIVNGTPYDNFISGEVNIRLDVLCNSFNFVIARNENSPLPFRNGSDCKIEINGILVLTGVIEIMDINYSPTTHTIVISGRDTTSDLVDSTIDILDDLGKGIGLKAIIEAVLSGIGSGIAVVEETATANFDVVDSKSSGESAINAFGFCEKVARKRQVLLTSNSEGNVAITQGGKTTLANANLQNVIGADDNNIISSSASYNNSSRFFIYKVISQGNPSAAENDRTADLGTFVNVTKSVKDGEIRKGRQFIVAAEESSNDDDVNNRAKWERNIRKTRGIVYSASVRGFSYDGVEDGPNIWLSNNLISIVDEFAGITDTMLINSVSFRLDNDDGETTQLTMVDKDAYSLDFEESGDEGLGEGIIGVTITDTT